MPPAPEVFSIITCCPSASERPTARTRPAVSDELPAANGTTMVTGRCGQLCADAAPTVTKAVRAESETSATLFVFNMMRSLLATKQQQKTCHYFEPRPT